MADGSALPRFKRAFIAKLESLGVPNVSYQSPMEPEEMTGDDGSGLCAWFGDEAEASNDLMLMGSAILYIDETWNVPFRIQALGVDTEDTQEVLDQRACERLGDVLDAFGDPSFAIDDDSRIQFFHALPLGQVPWSGGVIPTNLRAARYELAIEVKARINIARTA